jgi:predicted component of type VI protein secretion system
MSLITLRVLDGADQGRVFQNLSTPVTIGREEGNLVQLNDERVSRYHLKIQEDQQKFVLTDLESTNGTRVNGENVKLWILRHGDLITIGRSVLLFGSATEIARRLAGLRGADLAAGAAMEGDDPESDASASFSLESEMYWGDEPNARVTLHTLLPPELPSELSPAQAAQLTELLQYLHLRLRGLVDSVSMAGKAEKVVLEQRQWQNLLDLHDRLAGYLRQAGEPEM